MNERTLGLVGAATCVVGLVLFSLSVFVEGPVGTALIFLGILSLGGSAAAIQKLRGRLTEFE